MLPGIKALSIFRKQPDKGFQTISEPTMIALLIDADNFSSPAWIEEAFQTLERTEGPIAIRRAYGSTENLRGLAEIMRTHAIRPFVNLSILKNTTDMSLAVDAMELACLTPRPKLMVIASGDLDFIPLVVRLRERAIRVVCVSERSKMAQDAIPAYDQVIYVGADPVVSPVVTKLEAIPAPVADIAVVPPKAVASIPVVKPSAPKPVATKKAPAQKEPATKAPEKKTSVKQVAKKTTAAKPVVTPKTILAAVPNLQTGQWLPLGDVAKILHDKKLLAKSATSSKLLRKFPEHFELLPTAKPNKVRVIKS